MKALFLIGGFAGFLTCAGFGLLAGHAPDMVLRDAAFGTLAGAMLFRWFGHVLIRSVLQSAAERQAAAARQEAEARAAAANTKAAAVKPAPAGPPGRPAARPPLPVPTPAVR